MKIAVENKIIDTEKIYSVSDEILEHYNNGYEYYFVVTSFNDHKIKVSLNKNEPNKISEELEKLREIYGSNPSDEQWEKMKELRIQISTENKNRLERMRQDIIKIWSENQLSIPNFNTKNY